MSPGKKRSGHTVIVLLVSNVTAAEVRLSDKMTRDRKTPNKTLELIFDDHIQIVVVFIAN